MSGASRSNRAGRRRISSSGDFERAYRRGRSQANRHLVVYAFPRGGLDGPRLGVSVSRKLGGAVQRNRVKRLLRESFASRAQSLPAGSDYVVVARVPARELAERDGLSGVDRSLGELLSSLGAADGQSAGASNAAAWGSGTVRT